MAVIPKIRIRHSYLRANASSGTAYSLEIDAAISAEPYIVFTGLPDGLSDAGAVLTYEDSEELLDSLKTVDGSGSGLDADTVDGSHAADFISAADLTTHAALDTGVHGAGVDTLATDADIDADVATHAALDTGVHGAGGDTLATDADIDADVATHAALDTGVHGAGGDTLATDADIDADVATHAALDTGVHGAGGDTLATDADIATHNADETAHGIEYIIQFIPYLSLPYNRSATSYDTATIPLDCTLNSFGAAVYVATTNNGSHYWTATLIRTSDGATLGTFDTSGIAPNTLVRLVDTTLANNALVAATHGSLTINWTKTGSPGNLSIRAPFAVATK